jgi:tight adherence protein B
MSRAMLLAFGAGTAGVLAAWEALAAVEATRVADGVGRLLSPLARAAQEGRAPSTVERRRLALVAAGCLLAGGWLVAGPAAGVLAALGGPGCAVALIRSRRRRYSRALERGAPAAARALADAIGGGHSVRGAIGAAAPGVEGSAGHELRRTAATLELGEPTPGALEALRERARSPAWDTLVAAMLLQREAGGDLARLLRELATSLEAGRRADRDAERGPRRRASRPGWCSACRSARCCSSSSGAPASWAGCCAIRSPRRSPGSRGSCSSSRRPASAGSRARGSRRDGRRGAVGAAAALAVVALGELLATRPRRPAPRVPRRGRAVVVAGLRRLGRGVGPAAAPRDLAARLDASGLDITPADFVAVKAGAGLLALIVCLPPAPGLPGRLPLLLPLAVPAAAFLVPDAWLRRRIQARTARMERELADVLDLVRVAVAPACPPTGRSPRWGGGTPASSPRSCAGRSASSPSAARRPTPTRGWPAGRRSTASRGSSPRSAGRPATAPRSRARSAPRRRRPGRRAPARPPSTPPAPPRRSSSSSPSCSSRR